MRAAYFLLSGLYHGRPLDRGVIEALLSAGYDVDVYAPRLPEGDDVYPGSVRCFEVHYRMKWFRGNLNPWKWRRYSLFLGTCDIPMAFVGVLSAMTGRKSVTVCDEVYTGGYQGQSRYYWGPLTKRGMRRSAMTVITDEARIDLQRSYAGLPKAHRFIQLPCAFVGSRYQFDAPHWKRVIGADNNDCVLALSGETSCETGAHWALAALDGLSTRYKLLMQPGGSVDMLTDVLLRRLARQGNVLYVPNRNASFIEAMSVNLAADIGLVFYLSPKPQFQQMGVSSNKLCMYLQMGKPVIASRQKSFSFLEEWGAGVMIDSHEELPAAVKKIEEDYDRYSKAALDCFREYINPADRLERLKEAFVGLSLR